jgi:hypothetical protein
MFRPRHPLLPHGHPERGEGSAFLFSPVRALGVPALSSSLFPAVGYEPSAAIFALSSFWALTRLLSSFRGALCASPYQYQSTQITPPLFSYSYALFCTIKNAISNRFISFRTLCTKHPGWGTPSRASAKNSNPSVFHLKLSTFSCFPPNSHRITSFAHPHPLTPIESHSCRIRGGCQFLGNRGTDGTFSGFWKPGDRRDVFWLLTFPHISTAISNQLAPAQPLQILPLAPSPFEYQLSNPESY